MELIKNPEFVKDFETPTKDAKSKVLEDLEEAMNEVNLIKAGKLKGVDAKELLMRFSAKFQ